MQPCRHRFGDRHRGSGPPVADIAYRERIGSALLALREVPAMRLGNGQIGFGPRQAPSLGRFSIQNLVDPRGIEPPTS